MADEAQVRELELALMRAVQCREMAPLERMLGPGFTLTTGRPGKEVRSLDEWLRVTEHEYTIEEFHFEEMVVQMYPGCAIVRSRLRQRGSMGNQRRNSTYRMTDVWISTDGAWKLEARHAQRIEGD